MGGGGGGGGGGGRKDVGGKGAGKIYWNRE